MSAMRIDRLAPGRYRLPPITCPVCAYEMQCASGMAGGTLERVGTDTRVPILTVCGRCEVAILRNAAGTCVTAIPKDKEPEFLPREACEHLIAVRNELRLHKALGIVKIPPQA